MGIRACIFDAYGTLFDVDAAARAAASEPGGGVLAEAWPGLARSWRAKQLQYTWLRAVAGHHRDFLAVTGDALDWALEEAGLAGDAALRDRLMELYLELDAYPEVADMLAALRAQGLASGILSNGTPEMLDRATASAGLTQMLDAILSVEAVGIYKPDARIYALVEQHFGTAPEEVLFVSSNGWDAAGAAAFGFVTAWVNRAGLPQDRLFARPAHVLSDLTTIPELT